MARNGSDSSVFSKTQKKTDLSRPRKGRSGVLVSSVTKAMRTLYSLVSGGLLARAFASYSTLENKFNPKCAERRFAPPGKVRKATSKFLNTGRAAKPIIGFSKLFTSMPLSAFGFFFLAFSVMTAGAVIIKDGGFDGFTMERICLISALIISSVVCFFSNGTLIKLMSGGVLFNGFYYDLPTIGDKDLPTTRTKTKAVISILIGVFSGGLTYHISPYLMLGILALSLVTLMVLSVPEIGVLIMFALIPFAAIGVCPDAVFVILIGITSLGYILSFLRGAASFRFGIIDLLVMLFALTTIAVSAYSGGAESTRISHTLFVLTCGYFLCVNLLNTRAIVNRAIRLIKISVTLFCLFETAIHLADRLLPVLPYDNSVLRWISILLDTTIAWDIDKNALAVFALILLPFSVCELTKPQMARKLGGIVSICILAMYILGFGPKTAIVACICSLIIMFLITSYRSLSVTLFALPPITAIVVWVNKLWGSHRTAVVYQINRLLPENRPIDLSLEYRLDVIRDSLRIFFTDPKSLFGIGFGEKAFSAFYTSVGSRAASDAGNIFIQTSLERGVLGLILFILIMLSLFSMIADTIVKSPKDSGRMFIIGCFASFISLLTVGSFDNVFAHPAVYLCFWLMIGLTVSLSEVERIHNYRVVKGAENSSSAYDIAMHIV